MYSHCIFCSAGLGANEVLETFPVGRKVAFDARKGRLWAVCPACGRWNLAPIEERWEAVEAAEKQFVDTRTRVQSENIGLARLPDGTRLVRVGAALPGELAAWRYGEQLVRRHRRQLIVGGSLVVVGGAMGLGATVLAAGGALTAFNLAVNGFNGIRTYRRNHQVIHMLDTDRALDGRPVPLNPTQLEGISLVTDDNGDVAVQVPGATLAAGGPLRRLRRVPGGQRLPPHIVRGEEAQRLLARAMPHLNRSGASRRKLEPAVKALTSAGDAREFLRELARRRPHFIVENKGVIRLRPHPFPILRPHEALALEMAANEDSERRALEGELAALEAAWQEAEEIAAIADALPDDRLSLPRRILRRAGR